jgi:hypothetical protein
MQSYLLALPHLYIPALSSVSTEKHSIPNTPINTTLLYLRIQNHTLKITTLQIYTSTSTPALANLPKTPTLPSRNPPAESKTSFAATPHIPPSHVSEKPGAPGESATCSMPHISYPVPCRRIKMDRSETVPRDLCRFLEQNMTYDCVSSMIHFSNVHYYYPNCGYLSYLIRYSPVDKNITSHHIQPGTFRRGGVFATVAAIRLHHDEN